MTMTIRPLRTIKFIGLSETNTIGSIGVSGVSRSTGGIGGIGVDSDSLEVTGAASVLWASERGESIPITPITDSEMLSRAHVRESNTSGAREEAVFPVTVPPQAGDPSCPHVRVDRDMTCKECGFSLYRR